MYWLYKVNLRSVKYRLQNIGHDKDIKILKSWFTLVHKTRFSVLFNILWQALVKKQTLKFIQLRNYYSNLYQNSSATQMK